MNTLDTAYTDVYARPNMDDGPDADLLSEIRDRYKAWDETWEPIRKERTTDMRYIAGRPWSDEDLKQRAGRPCINHDELSQYVNQLVNGVRQSKRGIKVDPAGDGTNDETARLRQDLIRTIEYGSNAGSIYANAFQAMVEGSYAFFRISRRYVTNKADAGDRSAFDQEIVIRPIANPSSVVYDPECKEPDWSDARGCFLLDRISRREFRRRYPKAEFTSFSTHHMDIAPGWSSDDQVLLAEYWRVETKRHTIYLLESGAVTDKPRDRKVEKKRVVEEKSIMHYVTNGLEILERSDEPEPGTLLPIIPMVGLERYEDDGISRRVLYSLVRLARDPQMSLAYLNSQEMEEAGLTPKSPFIGYKGQFDSSRDQWQMVTRQAVAFLESDIPDNWPAGQVPPLPQRVPFTPNFAAYEVAKDSCRRAIQAAMGITPLPTAMQRQSEKSGVALQRIENLEALGSYHFIDGYDRSLRLAGRVIDQWIPAVYCHERKLHLRKPDDSYRQVTLNSAPYWDPKANAEVCYPVEEVDHSIAISTGPSYSTQREATNDFLDTLIGQMPQLPITPPQGAKLLALAIQLKDLGPKGDQMAEIISPTEGSPDQAAAQAQQLQAQSQQQAMVIQQLQTALQQLAMEKQAKVVEQQGKMALEQLRSQASVLTERLKVDAQIATAEIQTKAQIEKERQRALADVYQQTHQQVHEARTQQTDHAHELELSRREHMAKAIEGDQQREHEADMQQGQIEAQAEQPDESGDNEQE